MKRAVVREVSGAVAKTTVLVESGAKLRIMTGPKTGQIYKVSKTGKKHQASAPGESPATDTGKLANSITSSSENLRGVVDVHAEYAEPLEYGTVDGTLAARPFLTPAVEDQRDAFEKSVEQAIQRATR